MGWGQPGQQPGWDVGALWALSLSTQALPFSCFQCGALPVATQGLGHLRCRRNVGSDGSLAALSTRPLCHPIGMPISHRSGPSVPGPIWVLGGKQGSTSSECLSVRTCPCSPSPSVFVSRSCPSLYLKPSGNSGSSSLCPTGRM